MFDITASILQDISSLPIRAIPLRSFTFNLNLHRICNLFSESTSPLSCSTFHFWPWDVWVDQRDARVSPTACGSRTCCNFLISLLRNKRFGDTDVGARAVLQPLNASNALLSTTSLDSPRCETISSLGIFLVR